MSKCLTTLGLLALASMVPAVRADVTLDQLRPGLIATFQDATGDHVVRLEPIAALGLGKGEASHPWLGSEGGTVHWQGYLNVLQPGDYRFSVMLRGRVRVRVGKAEVLAGEVAGETAAAKEGAPVHLEADLQPLDVEFHRLPGIARLELFWQGPGLYREPVPYDVCFHGPKAETDDLRRDTRREFGRLLAEELGCANCHSTMEKPLAERKGPDLSQIGRRAYAGWIDRWLADPHALRPGTTMPSMFADDADGRVERFAVTSYLISLGGPIRPSQPIADARERRKSVDSGKALFTSSGCILCHPAKMPATASSAQTIYGFAGAGTNSAYPLGAVGSKTTNSALTGYLTDPLAVSPHGRMPSLLLKGSEAADLARYLCETYDTSISQGMSLEPPGFAIVWKRVMGSQAEPHPRNWRTLGRSLISAKGCLSCHELNAADVKRPTAPVPLDPKRVDRGCLAEMPNPNGPAPRYSLRTDERAALRDFIAAPHPKSPSPAPAFAAGLALRRFNCLACHQRDGEGGLSPDQAEELRRYEKADNADSAVPPPLTAVAHKLLTPALRGVLVDRQRVRPWTGLRMPHYGMPNVESLAAGLTALEGVDATELPHREAFSTEMASAGRVLVGKSGFGCISCHDFAGMPNTGTRGPDLTLGVSRLRFDWYRRWLEQPQHMQPGTRMPQVFTDGKSTIDRIFAGHADKQADAMWAYCAAGGNLPLPDGLEPPSRALAVSARDRPVVLRTFMPEAGSRAVAVGYPGGVSVAFDVATARLAYAWSGNFLDAAPVWTGRGGNPARPLGPRFWTAPAGTPWGLGSLPPDFAARAKDPAYGVPPPEGKFYAGPRTLHFEGYDLDANGTPTFRYQIETGPAAVLKVRETVEPLYHPVALGFARRFQIATPSGQTAWFLAAQSIVKPRIFDGSRLLDIKDERGELPDTARMLLVKQSDNRLMALSLREHPPRATWRVERQGNKWDVLLKLPAGNDERPEAVAVRVWSLPSDDADLLRSLMMVGAVPPRK